MGSRTARETHRFQKPLAFCPQGTFISVQASLLGMTQGRQPPHRVCVYISVGGGVPGHLCTLGQFRQSSACFTSMLHPSTFRGERS